MKIERRSQHSRTRPKFIPPAMWEDFDPVEGQQDIDPLDNGPDYDDLADPQENDL